MGSFCPHREPARHSVMRWQGSGREGGSGRGGGGYMYTYGWFTSLYGRNNTVKQLYLNFKNKNAKNKKVRFFLTFLRLGNIFIGRQEWGAWRPFWAQVSPSLDGKGQPGWGTWKLAWKPAHKARVLRASGVWGLNVPMFGWFEDWVPRISTEEQGSVSWLNNKWQQIRIPRTT